MREQSLLLELEFQRRGPLSASDIGLALKISQPSVSRLLKRLGQKIARLGRGRSTLYGMVRQIGPLGSEWPLYEIDPHGKPYRVGILQALRPSQWCLQQEAPWDSLRATDFPHGLYPDLPWFLDDLRPQGFLGRNFARVFGEVIGAPADPRSWSADLVVEALLRHGHDLQGSFVLGEAMLAEAQGRMLNTGDALPAASRLASYPKLADAMLAGEWPGSSAGGEQPKFTARVLEPDNVLRHVIVKFCGRGGHPADQRWTDLLVAEHLAASLLFQAGVPAAQTAIVESGGRVFLESNRFDRVGNHGRRGLVSLFALDGAFFDPTTPWIAAAKSLYEGGWISREDAERLTLVWWFGNLIGNSDMHQGNASLFLDRDRPLSLAPVYDMTPMLYRPDPEGGLSERLFAPLPPRPESMTAWLAALTLAETFWSTLAQSSQVSVNFRTVAEQNRVVLSRHRKQFA